MLRGIDVSSWQGDIDWNLVVGAGYSFALVKCTGGVKYRNPYYAKQINGARAAGMVVGHYHYDGEPSVGGGTAAQEAAFFLSQLDLQPGELVALDVEERSTRDPQRYRAWLDAVAAATGARPLFYSFHSFIAELGAAAWEPVKDFPLWFASYDDPPLDAPAPWTKWTILQYTGGSPVPGTSFPTDLNRFPGTIDDLRALGKPQSEQPQTKPTAPGMDSSAQTTGWYITDKGQAVVWANFGGTSTAIQGVNYADLGVTTTGQDGATYDRSIVAGEWQEWVKR